MNSQDASKTVTGTTECCGEEMTVLGDNEFKCEICHAHRHYGKVDRTLIDDGIRQGMRRQITR